MVARPTSEARVAPGRQHDDDVEPLFEPGIRRRLEFVRISGERRMRFENLALGVPITAAFVGVFLAEHGGVFAEASSGAADVLGARGAGARTLADVGHEPGTGTTGLPAVDAGSLAAGAAGGSTVSLAATPAVSANFGHISGETSASQIPTAEASAGVSAKATVMAGPEVNISFGGLQLPLFGDPLGLGANAGGPGLDPIGRFFVGADGDDLIIGTDRADYLAGGAGDDEIHGLAGNDTLDGGTGDDLLYGDAGDDLLLGRAGHDELHGGTGNDDLRGGPGNDDLFGGSGRDILAGGLGDDELDGGTGSDRMIGGQGDDVSVVDDIHDVARERSGRPGDEVGPDGSDTLVVSQGFSDDLLAEFGGAEASFQFSENIGDNVDLPPGVDGRPHQVGPGIDHVVLQGTAGHDVIGDSSANRLTGNDGDNILFGNGGDDILAGGAGVDRLDGGAGADQLQGGAHDDILAGGGGDDDVFGDAGDDILEGGPGADRLEGGAGNDTYLIGLSEGDAGDTIFDHEGVNEIRLEGVGSESVHAALIGDDLEIFVDHGEDPIAAVEGYRGNEESFAGIDTGNGLRSIAELVVADTPDSMADGPEDPPASGSGDDDILGAIIAGTDGDDALEGTPFDDILEGGAGNDVLQGGAGDDRYLFEPGDGRNVIDDAEGSTVAELNGFADASVHGWMDGGDLNVVVNFAEAPLFTVKNVNESGFDGVSVDGTLHEWNGSSFQTA